MSLKNKCQCRRSNCILESYNTFVKYVKDREIADGFDIFNIEPKKRAPCVDGSVISIQECIKFDFFLMYPCDLAKSAIKLRIFNKNETINYRLFYEATVIQMKKNNELNIKRENLIIKLKNILKTNLTDLAAAFKLQNYNETLISNLNIEKKKLKNENKKMKIIIKNHEYKNKEINLNYDLNNENDVLDDDLDDDLDDHTKELNNNLNHDLNTELSNQNKTLKIYDSIIKYLVFNNISIGKLFERMNLTKNEIKKYITKFINLKISRIKIAHPENIIKINNDIELLNLFNDI